MVLAIILKRNIVLKSVMLIYLCPPTLSQISLKNSENSFFFVFVFVFVF